MAESEDDVANFLGSGAADKAAKAMAESMLPQDREVAERLQFALRKEIDQMCAFIVA